MGAIIWLLLGQSVSYFFVLACCWLVVLLASSCIFRRELGAGSGVYRATGWGAYLQRHNIAALLAYRVLYYFIPLLLALSVTCCWKARRRSYGRKMKRHVKYS